MQTLTQFIFRLSFGMSLAMTCVSPRLVTSGYYRNNLYLLLGLNVLAALAGWITPSRHPSPMWPAATAALLSYIGAAAWLYEKPRAGMACLALVAAATLAGAWLADGRFEPATTATPAAVLRWLDPACGGLVLGVTLAAMLLGHWYLNAPGMSLAPLKRLVLLMGAVVLVRGVTCGLGLGLEIFEAGPPGTQRLLFVALRWLSGICASALLTVMAWKTLRIPNTQSATGILYVAVIVTFVGELTGMLLLPS